MKYSYKKQLLTFLLIFSCISIKTTQAESENKQIVESVKRAINDVNNEQLSNKQSIRLLKQIEKKDPTEFNEEELYTFVTKTLNNIKPILNNLNNNNLKYLEEIKTLLINKLKLFKVTGTSFSVTLDPNVAFIYDNFNPDIEITYKNNDGEHLTKKYKSSISSIGFKFEAAIVIDFIFTVGTDLDFFKSKDTIELGSGISIGIPQFLSVTYSKIKNGPGGILILGLPLGLSLHGINYVIGGTLKAK